ncbi:MAG TPA: TRZ/ATZ family hydrolase [Burkholderiales bacterium]|nr:TRZ/ATZ family hydrolase [Burkholderiales bacterium]
MNADAIIEPRWVIPVEPAGVVLERHAVVIRDGVIREILPVEEAARIPSKEREKLSNHVLIPGLVNLHTHAAMTLMRGLADDLPLMRWLNDHIWPAEARHVSDRFVYDGTLLACAEMLKGGVTCFADMYFFPEAAARAALAARMRAALGIILIDFPTAYAVDAEDYLAKGMATRDELREEARISFCLAPHAPYTLNDKMLARVAMYANELDLPIHMHVQETEGEIGDSLARFQLRPLSRLRALGLVGPGLIAVHAVHLERSEIELLAEHGCHIAHCPSSNLKLASGVAPVAQLLAAGVNVGLGTDGAASNNRLDLFEEMRLAALLAKAMSGSADTLPAHQALRMATLNSARALGLDSRIGSIEVGKAADFAAVDLSGLSLAPCYDPASHLVYCASRNDVTHVWSAGELLLQQRNLLKLDEREICALAHAWSNKLGSSRTTAL